MPDFSPMILREKSGKEVAMNAFRAKRQAKGRIDLLPPEPGAAARRHGERFPARRDVVDADFVVIRAGSARTSNANHRPIRPGPAVTASPPLPVRAAAAGARLCETGLQLLSGRAFAGLVTASVIFVFAYAGGLSALRAALPAAGPVAALRVAEVATTVDDRNGMKVLSVFGRVENISDRVQTVPPLEIRVEGSGRMLQRQVALETGTLAAGSSGHFALRIPHGGGKVPKVSVSLAAEGAPAN